MTEGRWVEEVVRCSSEKRKQIEKDERQHHPLSLSLLHKFLCFLRGNESYTIAEVSSTRHTRCLPSEPVLPFHRPPSVDTYLSEVKFELLAVELGLVQLDAGTGGGLRGAEVDPDSPEAFEHLESDLLVVNPKQCLEPLLGMKGTEEGCTWVYRVIQGFTIYGDKTKTCLRWQLAAFTACTYF